MIFYIIPTTCWGVECGVGVWYNVTTMKEKRRRDKYIQIRVTVGERRRAKVEAKKVGVSVGRMVREMVRYITYNRKEFKRWVKSGGLAGEGESKGGSGGGQKYRRSAEV